MFPDKNSAYQGLIWQHVTVCKGTGDRNKKTTPQQISYNTLFINISPEYLLYMYSSLLAQVTARHPARSQQQTQIHHVLRWYGKKIYINNTSLVPARDVLTEMTNTSNWYQQDIDGLAQDCGNSSGVTAALC